MSLLTLPTTAEHAPHAATYLTHVRDVPNILEHLEEGARRIEQALALVLPDRLHAAPRPGEWTAAEIVQHLIDDERIYAYRTLRFARGDHTELPGFDQDRYAAASGASSRTRDELLQEFTVVRQSTVELFRSLPAGAERRIGRADGNPMSVRAAAFHIAGHEVDHLRSIHRDHGTT